MKRFTVDKLTECNYNIIAHDSNGRTISCIGCTHDSLIDLMREIQNCLPMEVCESSDIKMVNSYAKHLNSRLRTAEAKIVSLENDLSGHAGEHMKNNLVEKVGNLERGVDSLKGLFDRHYGKVACGWCQESKTVARLVCDINCLTTVVEHLKYKLNEATK